MVIIKKRVAPQVLLNYKRDKNANFNDFPDKSIVRDCLIKEQFGLCAYCMSRISTTMNYNGDYKQVHCKIEHFKSQSKYPNLQLDYQNMLGCCNGNEGKPLKYQTCDTHKQDLELMFNPSDENDYEKMRIKFYKDGTIHSGNEEFDVQINSVLNLNAAHLVAARKALLDAAFNVLNKCKGTRTKSEIQHLINKYESLENGMHKPYYYVVVYYLRKHLK